jgi:hypothetical protein
MVESLNVTLFTDLNDSKDGYMARHTNTGIPFFRYKKIRTLTKIHVGAGAA